MFFFAGKNLDEKCKIIILPIKKDKKKSEKISVFLKGQEVAINILRIAEVNIMEKKVSFDIRFCMKSFMQDGRGDQNSHFLHNVKENLVGSFEDIMLQESSLLFIRNRR